MGGKLSKHKTPDPPAILKKHVDPFSCVYAKPKRKDVAIGFVYFNPAASKRMLMNYLYAVEKLKTAGIPYYTLELAFGVPEIHNAFHVKGSSILFHKENLCGLLEKRIPWRFSKILFLDADIIFSNPHWYSELSRALDSYEVVHPFASACWLDITYKHVMDERLSAVYMDRTKIYNPAYHPGFGWAFQRRWFRKVGFYRYGITGSGDTLSAAAWLGVLFPPTYLKKAFVKSYTTYRANAQPSISCISGSIYHLWHGTRANRKYVERHAILDAVKNVEDIVSPNRDGVLELTDNVVRDKLKAYFVGREDDMVA